MRGRRGRVAIATCAVAVVFASGWGVATVVQSPSQREALAAPPPALPLTVAVQRGDLAETTTVQAAVTRSAHAAVILATPPGAVRAVVTTTHASTGDAASSFVPVVSVNDRPVFLIPGKLTPYRDLVEGDRGSDVHQLQEALRLAGYDVSTDEQEFGATTRSALLAAYAAGGYSPMAQTPAGPTSIVPSGIDHSTHLVVPMSELAVVDLPFPVTIDSVPKIGTDATGDSSVIAASSGEAVALADMPDGILARMSVGQQGTIGTYTDTPVEVTVTNIDPGEPESGVAGSITLTPASGQTIPLAWLQTTVVATVTVENVARDALIVPSRAITRDATGKASVLRAHASGASAETISVTVIGELNGLAAIASVGDGPSVGDLVVID